MPRAAVAGNQSSSKTEWKTERFHGSRNGRCNCNCDCDYSEAQRGETGGRGLSLGGNSIRSTNKHNLTQPTLVKVDLGWSRDDITTMEATLDVAIEGLAHQELSVWSTRCQIDQR